MSESGKKISLAEKLSAFSDHYSPRTVATFNGHDIMVVKLLGPFTWHSHPDTDDFFLVVKGTLRIELRMPEETSVTLGPGELFIVPRGVEHRYCRGVRGSPPAHRADRHAEYGRSEDRGP